MKKNEKKGENDDNKIQQLDNVINLEQNFIFFMFRLLLNFTFKL